MAGKRKDVQGRLAAANERVRNRASPDCIVKLCEHLNADQKRAIQHMSLGSMLNIKCPTLHNPVINWLAPKYDRFSREFIIPGRGRIPLTAASVYRSMGLPCGELPVAYRMDASIEKRLGPILFPNHPNTHHTTQVFTILKEMTTADKNFKQIWIMYLVSTVLAPTSLNKVSSRCYPIMDKVEEVKNMNICQFVCDKLHDELSAGKLSGACLLHMMLLYVDSLDISALNILLPEAPFLVNIWSKANIDIVLDADMKRDFSGFGNLELKPHLATDHRFFGGIDGFHGFIDTNTAHNCPKPRKEKVARLVGEFAASITRLLSTLVQGWTEVDDDDSVLVEQSIIKISKQFGVDSTSNTDKHIQVNTAVSLGGSKGSDSVIPEVCRPEGDSILKNVDIAKSPGKHAASGVSKVNDVQNQPAPHVDSSDHYGGDCVTPRVTHSASAATRARYSDEGNINLIVSQSEHTTAGLDDSENNEYNDADRFFIKSRVVDAGENPSMACFSSASHDSTMLTHRFVVDASICDLGKLADMAVLQEGGVLPDDENSDSRILTNECKDKRSGPLSEFDGINPLGSGMTVTDVVSHVAPAAVVELAQYNSHDLKRKSEDVATECVASIVVSDVIGRSPQENTDVHVSKKQRKPLPKREKPKANAQATRSSPRFTTKHNVKSGANMESEAATSSAASVQQIGLNHGVSLDSTPTEVILKSPSVVAQSSPPIKRRLSSRLRIPTPVSDAYNLDGEHPVRAAGED